MGMIIRLNIPIQPHCNLPPLRFNTFTNNTAWRRFIVWLKNEDVSTGKKNVPKLCFLVNLSFSHFYWNPLSGCKVLDPPKSYFTFVYRTTAMLDITVMTVYHKTVATEAWFWRTGLHYKCTPSPTPKACLIWKLFPPDTNYYYKFI